ncbi:hypothetical protein DFH08DRAFT_810002 [Mycena albidolilacea]|uniref:Uncharacterized protein n=1 Tax=Mycena albidolilacea TaxID=1033008 RepID=A0AAD7EQZ9_9AGAR|nr:hypothetical protein DFH08DRAFT_810002 [Mycena albidolilacea]
MPFRILTGLRPVASPFLPSTMGLDSKRIPRPVDRFIPGSASSPAFGPSRTIPFSATLLGRQGASALADLARDQCDVIIRRKRPRSKKARVGPEHFQFKCSGCEKEFKHIVKHLTTIKKDTSKCKQNRFRVRPADGSFSAETTLDLWRASMESAAATASAA